MEKEEKRQQRQRGMVVVAVAAAAAAAEDYYMTVRMLLACVRAPSSESNNKQWATACEPASKRAGDAVVNNCILSAAGYKARITVFIPTRLTACLPIYPRVCLPADKSSAEP